MSMRDRPGTSVGVDIGGTFTDVVARDAGVSTGKLNASLRLHTRPINVVVFNVPSGLSRSQGELISAGWTTHHRANHPKQR